MTGKTPYSSRPLAAEVATVIRNRNGACGQVYQCHYCKAFHVSAFSEQAQRVKRSAFVRRHFISEESCG